MGSSSTSITYSTFNSLTKLGKVVEPSYIIYSLTACGPHKTTPKGTIPSSLQPLLQEFSEVFNKPCGLPPSRSHEHHIYLFKDAQPINVRPYRYPYIQKQEIERLIQEMLSDGIIRHNHSPFSSPVLLVKKKDGSWRIKTMC